MHPRAIQTIFLGGAVIAILDIILAIGFWALYRDVSPQVILQSIAAGVLGKAAFSGGAQTAWLGAGLHLFIACGIATVYYAGCRLWPTLLQKPPAIVGPLYGIGVYLIMTYVVVPLSQAGSGSFDLAWFLTSIFSHVVLVGLPLAFIARWSTISD